MAEGHREAAPKASLKAASTVAGWRQVEAEVGISIAKQICIDIVDT
jgi:hypothetical protein